MNGIIVEQYTDGENVQIYSGSMVRGDQEDAQEFFLHFQDALLKKLSPKYDVAIEKFPKYSPPPTLMCMIF